MIDPASTVSPDATTEIFYDEDIAISPKRERANSQASSTLCQQPIQATRNYFFTLSEFFTWKFLSWIAIYTSCITGGVWTLVSTLNMPLFKELGIDASSQQLYATLMFSPWVMKPFTGVASDLFVINGFNKRYLAIFSILTGFSGSIILLVYSKSLTDFLAVDQSAKAVKHVADILVLCFTAISFEAATLDILGEGKYSEIMTKNPESGSSLVSFKYGCFLFGAICTRAYVGPLSDAGHWHILACIALSLSLAPLYPTIRGWLPEKHRTTDAPGMVKLSPGFLFYKGFFLKKKTPFIIIILSGLAGPIVAAITTYVDLPIGLITATSILLLLMLTTFLIFPNIVFRVALAFALMSISTPTVGSSLGYFYTADEKCLPNGPHFNYTFYVTFSGMLSSVVSLFSVILYETFLSKWSYRSTFIFTIVVGSLASVVDLIIVKRWNIVIGVTDKVFFILGNTIFENIIATLSGVAMSSVFAKIVPPGMESALFAYTAGIINFCGMVSGLLGSGIIRWSGMETVGYSCNFDYLPHIIVVWQILVPMLVGIPASFLIPNILQTEPLIDWTREMWYEDQEDDIRETHAQEDDAKFEPLVDHDQNHSVFF